MQGGLRIEYCSGTKIAALDLTFSVVFMAPCFHSSRPHQKYSSNQTNFWDIPGQWTSFLHAEDALLSLTLNST